MSGERAAACSVARAEARARDAALALDEIEWGAAVPGATRSRFAAPSGEIAMMALGDPEAPRIVLVPGATGSKEDFELMLPLLAAAGYYVQTFDLAGQYESHRAGPDPDGTYSLRLFTDDLIAVLEAGSPAHLLGYSFAGIVAVEAACERPELVRSVALLTTPPGRGNVFTAMKIIGGLARFATPRVGAFLMVWGVRTNMNRVPKRRLAFVRSRFRLTVRRSVDDMVEVMMCVPDRAARLRDTGLPVAVIASSHDLWPTHAHKAYAARLGADFTVYDTGHSPCETTPHELCFDLQRLFRRARV